MLIVKDMNEMVYIQVYQWEDKLTVTYTNYVKFN